MDLKIETMKPGSKWDVLIDELKVCCMISDKLVSEYWLRRIEEIEAQDQKEEQKNV